MSETYNPERDPNVQPFEVGDKIALTGEEWQGHTAVVTYVEWWQFHLWLVDIITDTGDKDVLAWYDCTCCLVWGEKITS